MLVAQQLGFGVERGEERTNIESLRETGLGTSEDWGDWSLRVKNEDLKWTCEEIRERESKRYGRMSLWDIRSRD